MLHVKRDELIVTVQFKITAARAVEAERALFVFSRYLPLTKPTSIKTAIGCLAQNAAFKCHHRYNTYLTVTILMPRCTAHILGSSLAATVLQNERKNGNTTGNAAMCAGIISVKALFLPDLNQNGNSLRASPYHVGKKKRKRERKRKRKKERFHAQVSKLVSLLTSRCHLCASQYPFGTGCNDGWIASSSKRAHQLLGKKST